MGGADFWANVKDDAESPLRSPLLKQPSAPESGAGSGLWAVAKANQDREDALLNAFQRAHQASPDEWAKMIKRGEAAGFSREVMEQFPAEAERRAKLYEAIRLSREAPATAAWLAKPDNMEVAKDDLDVLPMLEQSFVTLGKGLLTGGIFGVAKDRFATPFNTAEKATGQALRSGTLRTARGFVGIEQAAGESLSEYVTGPLTRNRILPEDIGARIGAFYREKGKAWEARAKAENGDWSQLPYLGRNALQGVESLVPSGVAAVTALVTRSPTLAAMFMAAPVGGEAYAEARDKGRGVAQSLTHGASQALIEYATEFIPASRMLQDLRLNQTFSTTLRNALAREIPGEQAATLLQDLNDWATLHPDKPFSEYLKARPDAAVQTLVATVIATGGQVSVAHLANESLNGGQRQADQMLMQSMGDKAAASKLRQRMPEKFRDLVDAITKDGPVENIRIPAQSFATYFQSVGVSPAEVAAQVGARNYHEALASGTDMVIPTGEYAAKIAGSEHHAALMPDIRLRDGDLTAREFEAYKRDREQTDKDIADAAKAEAAKAVGGVQQRIEEDIRNKLLAVGFAPATAEAYAAATVAPLVNLASRAGVDPMAMYERYGFDINRPMPEVLTRSGKADANLIGLIERLRAGEIPSDEQVYGQRITDFLRAKGGVRDVGGDLKSRDLDKGLKPFQPRLVRDDGMELDAALTAAREAGYLPDAPQDRPDDTGINELLDALHMDETQPVYSVRNLDQAAMDIRNQVEAVGRYLDDLGIDLSQVADNTQVLELMRRAGDVSKAGEDATVLAQMATPEGQPSPEHIAEAARQLDEVRARYEGTPLWMKAPNGEPTKLNERQWLQVRTPMFKAWFGDWENDTKNASKVVDENGEPRVVYHGTAAEFDVFQKPAENRMADRSRVGFWFTSAEWDAASYGVNVKRVYLSARKPRRITRRKLDEMAVTYPFPDLMKRLRAGGHDGLIIEAIKPDRALDEKGMPEQHVVFSPAQIKSAIGNVGTFGGETGNILYQSSDARRGYITIGAGRRLSISLLEKANLSTFLHETGHAWLEILGDLAESEGAPEQLRSDWKSILDYLGVASRADIATEHHEKWARSVEAYLMDGNAPSTGLREVFRKFKSWLTLIYRQMTALDVKLTPEVRGVLDRLYASEAEIETAKRELDAKPLFLDAAASGMTEAEFALYRAAIEEGASQGKEDLAQRLMREQRRETEKWWKEARATLRAEVEAEVDAQPVYRAFAALMAGQMPDGTPIKLNRADLVKRHGEAWLKTMPRGFGYLYAADGGVDADTAAELFGFSSGEEMLGALIGMRPRKGLIEAETDVRMRETYGDLLNDAEAMRQAAVKAMHNDRQAEVLAMELRALRKKRLDVDPFVRHEQAKAREEKRAARAVVDALPPISAFRDAAAGMIGQMQARDIRPGDYLRAGQKANREAFAAMAKGDHQAAYEAKRRELLNHYLYREALAAREEIDKLLDYARSFEKTAKRQRLGKAGADYLEQIDALLERYEFKRVTLRAMNRRTSLREWAAERERDGLMVNVPEAILDDAQLVNYREASTDTLRAVRDALTNIEHLAGLKNKLLKKKGAAEWEDVRQELLGALTSTTGSLGELTRANRVGEGVKDKGARLWRKFDASILKVEQIIEWLDGGRIDGPWARYFFDLADDAQTREYDLHRDITKRIQDLAESMPKEWRDSLVERVQGFALPGIHPSTATRHTLLSIALNAGNASNLDKLLRGYGWTEPQLRAALDLMTEADGRFVQGVWDILETLWPEIAALEKRVSGVEPPRVEPMELRLPWGALRGGYFPAAYDPRHSQAGEKQADASESVQDFMARGYGRMHTDKGHTKARLDSYAAPMLLDYEQVLTGHMNKVIKDLSHREAVIGINKTLKDRDIKRELIDRLGEEKYRLLDEWLQTLVSDRADTLNQSLGLWNGIFRGLRTNTAIVTMGWKISTMMSQIAGFGPSVDLVGYRNLSTAMVEFVTHPKATLDMVFGKSGEMRHRTNTIERDMKEQLLKLRGESGIKVAVQRSAFYLTAMADRMVSVPTWLAGYRKAKAENLAEEDAIRAGDRAVRLSQGAGGAKDLAAVQRQTELMKLLTMYYTPFSVLYARLRDVGHTTRSPRDLPRLVARSIALVILPAVLGELLAGRGPDDDEDETWWAARKSLLYPFASVPLLRDLVQWKLEPALVEATGGQMHHAPRYQFTPIISAIQKIGAMPDKTLDALTGDREWDEVAWDAFEASGYVFGMPTAQPRITGEYLADLLGGDENPESLADALHGLAFRRQH